jgi:phosphoglycolate phosphatase-like HAD superfamily hydrolase
MMKTNHLSVVAPDEVRVLLWDIDGTLLRSTRAGAFREYIVPAVESVFGTAGRLGELRHVSGMTDLQIVAEALRDEGITPERIRERVAELRTRFMIEMRRVAGSAYGTESAFSIAARRA